MVRKRKEGKGGSFRPVPFFPDAKEVRFELHPTDQFDKNSVTGGKVNQAKRSYDRLEGEKFDPRLAIFSKTRDSLFKNNLYFTPEWMQTRARLQNENDPIITDSINRILHTLQKERRDLTLAAKEVDQQYDRITKEKVKFRYDYLRKNKNIHSYSLILKDLLNVFHDVDVSTIREIYPDYAQKYPDHPYTKLIAKVLEGADSIKVGGHFVDFSAPDLEGHPQTLSKLIGGQVAIIDLWATWCGPCILHSRSLAPVYEAYHTKGFTIVGIAA